MLKSEFANTTVKYEQHTNNGTNTQLSPKTLKEKETITHIHGSLNLNNRSSGERIAQRPNENCPTTERKSCQPSAVRKKPNEIRQRHAYARGMKTKTNFRQPMVRGLPIRANRPSPGAFLSTNRSTRSPNFVRSSTEFVSQRDPLPPTNIAVHHKKSLSRKNLSSSAIVLLMLSIAKLTSGSRMPWPATVVAPITYNMRMALKCLNQSGSSASSLAMVFSLRRVSSRVPGRAASRCPEVRAWLNLTVK